MPKESKKIGWYTCALIDILGQKFELNRLDKIDSIKTQSLDVLDIFRNTYGHVKQLRELIPKSENYFNNVAERCIESPEIQHNFFSDLIVSYLSLSKHGEQLDICRLKFMLFSLSEVFLGMLARGVPLRGAIEIGIAMISKDDQIYGGALSKAYHLESNIAQSIRMVVGQELVDLLNLVARDSSNEFCDDAKVCLLLVKKDKDGVYILNYLASPFQETKFFQDKSPLAKIFLEGEANKFRKTGDYRTASKYENALAYFADSGVS